MACTPCCDIEGGVQGAKKGLDWPTSSWSSLRHSDLRCGGPSSINPLASRRISSQGWTHLESCVRSHPDKSHNNESYSFVIMLNHYSESPPCRGFLCVKPFKCFKLIFIFKKNSALHSAVRIVFDQCFLCAWKVESVF